MRRKLKNFRNKSGHNPSVGAPKQMLDEMQYREHGSRSYRSGKPYDSEYSGWSHASRPRDQAVSIRKRFTSGFTGISGPSGPT